MSTSNTTDGRYEITIYLRLRTSIVVCTDQTHIYINNKLDCTSPHTSSWLGVDGRRAGRTSGALIVMHAHSRSPRGAQLSPLTPGGGDNKIATVQSYYSTSLLLRRERRPTHDSPDRPRRRGVCFGSGMFDALRALPSRYAASCFAANRLRGGVQSTWRSACLCAVLHERQMHALGKDESTGQRCGDNDVWWPST